MCCLSPLDYDPGESTSLSNHTGMWTSKSPVVQNLEIALKATDWWNDMVKALSEEYYSSGIAFVRSP